MLRDLVLHPEALSLDRDGLGIVEQAVEHGGGPARGRSLAAGRARRLERPAGRLDILFLVVRRAFCLLDQSADFADFLHDELGSAPSPTFAYDSSYNL